MSKQNAGRYLYESLQLNPMTHADEIVERREVILGIRKTTARTKVSAASGSPTATTESAKSNSKKANEKYDETERRKVRENLKRRIEELRGNFCNMNAARQSQLLNAIPLKQFPELRAGVDRLKLMVSFQTEFNEIGHHKDKSTNLWNTFKRVVILAPQASGQLKEQYLRNLSHSGDLEKAKRTVNLIRSKYPRVYQLESDWFDQIRKARTRKGESGGINIDLGIPGWVVWVIVIFFLRLLAFAASG